MIRTIKTKQFKITAFVLALVLTVSCVLWNTTEVHAEEVTIGNVNTQNFSGMLRAITNDNKLVGTSEDYATMSVFITSDKTEGNYSITNGKWTHDGTDWSTDSPILFEGEDSSQQIYALSPYRQDATNGTVAITADGKTDWLVATSTELETSNVSLTMTHALTKLVIDPTFGTEVTDRAIEKIEVGGMYASGTLDIATNKWKDLQGADANTPLEMNNYELLIIPMASCTSFPITITMADGRTFETTVSLAGVGSQLAAGTQYNITLQVGQDVVSLGEITASSWISVTGGDLKTE